MKDDVFVTRELDKFESITQAIEEKGYSYSYIVLNQSVIESNKIVSEMLQIPIATKVFSYKKLRIVENRPRSIEQVYIEYNRVQGIEKKDLSDKSLYRVLKECFGYEVKRNEEEIRIVHINKEESELLKLDIESEVMMTTGLTYLESIKPFEYFQIIALPNFFKYRSVSKYE